MKRVTDKNEAWDMIKKFFPTAKIEQDKMCLNTYYCTGACPIAYIADLNARLELNMTDGTTFNIWIDEEPESFTVKVGLITEKKIFSSVTINEVTEIIYHNVIGFTNESLDDGKLGTIFYLSNGETASFHVNEIAYTKFDS